MVGHDFCHQKIVEGGSILIEGLAKYTEAVVMEKKVWKKVRPGK